MSVTGRDVLIASLFLVVGWVLHMLWDALLDWFDHMFGTVGGLLWDVCAIAGIIAVCVTVGFVVTHQGGPPGT